jgi:hypothetical protein
MNKFESGSFSRETMPSENNQRIENGVWRPGILDEFSDEVAAGFSTKEILDKYKSNQQEDSEAKSSLGLRLLGDIKRFDRPLPERIKAARVLAVLRNELSPDTDLHHIIKAQLANAGEVAKIDDKFVDDLKKGNLENKQILGTDGLITNLPDYPLYVSAADCFPVIMYDHKNKAIGLFHNGVYGFLKGISENGLRAMISQYGTSPEEVKVVIAPGISPEYVLAKDMLVAYKEKFPAFDLDKYTEETDDPEAVKFDLASAISDSLVRMGVSEDNIEKSKFNTDTNTELFSSERTEGRKERDSNGCMVVLKK